LLGTDRVGKLLGEWKPGHGSAKKPVVNSIYFDALAAEYACTSDQPADMFLWALDHRHWIFTRRGVVGRDAPEVVAVMA